MRQFVYYSIPALTHELIRRVKICLTREDIDEMKKRRDDLIGTLKLSCYENKVLAEKIFEMGFIAGMIEIKELEEENPNDIKRSRQG